MISSAGATSFFGDDSPIQVTSDVLPGVTRTVDSYQAMATEAGLSRIFAGVHTRLDHESGLGLGRDVANFVLRSAKSADLGSKAQSAAPVEPARYPGGY